MNKDIEYLLNEIANAPGFMGGSARYKSVSGSDSLYTADIEQLRKYIEGLETENRLYRQTANLNKDLSDLPKIGEYVYKQECLTSAQFRSFDDTYTDPTYMAALQAIFANVIAICKCTLIKYPKHILQFNWEICNSGLIGRPQFQLYLKEACNPASGEPDRLIDYENILHYIPIYEFPIVFMQVSDLFISKDGAVSMLLTADRTQTSGIHATSTFVRGDEIYSWTTDFIGLRDRLESALAAVLLASGISSEQFAFYPPTIPKDDPTQKRIV